MRLWRNRQTRTVEGRVGDRMGSSPISRTIQRINFDTKTAFYYWKAVFVFVRKKPEKCIVTVILKNKWRSFL